MRCISVVIDGYMLGTWVTGTAGGDSGGGCGCSGGDGLMAVSILLFIST